MTDIPKIPLKRRVMPTIIATDITGVSPMLGPSDAVMELAWKRREALNDDKSDTTNALPGDAPNPGK